MKLKLFMCMMLVLLLGSACSKVPAGNVGVKVYLLGGSKGVDSEELGPGRYWIGINEDLYLFPTFTQNYVWTKSPDEGSLDDESFTFQTMEGLTVGADVGISYSIDPSKVNTIFQKYRKGIDEITDIFMRNMVRDAFNQVVSTQPIESVYGEGKGNVLKQVEKMIKEQVSPIGINLEKIYFIGELRLPQTVVDALNLKISATQRAQQRENEIREAEADAKKKIAEADGEARSRLLKAKAEAEALEMTAKVLRENPQLIKYEAIKKWDGIMPKFTAGDNGVSSIFNFSDIK